MKAVLVMWIMLVGQEPMIEISPMYNMLTCEAVAQSLRKFAIAKTTDPGSVQRQHRVRPSRFNAWCIQVVPGL